MPLMTIGTSQILGRPDRVIYSKFPTHQWVADMAFICALSLVFYELRQLLASADREHLHHCANPDWVLLFPDAQGRLDVNGVRYSIKIPGQSA